MPTNKLAPRRIEGRLSPGLYSDGGGLNLQVRPTGRSWVFRYTPPGGGNQRYMGLGPFPDVGLAEARDLAYEARRLLRAGKDPLVEKHGEQAAVRAQAQAQDRPKPSFADVTRVCLAMRQEGLSKGHRDDSYRRLENHAFKVIGALPVDLITRQEVLAVLEPIWTTKHVTAKHVQQLMSLVFKRAVYDGHRVDNPAEWVGNLENALAPTKNVHRVENYDAIDYKDMPAFMAALRVSDTIEDRATEFTALSAMRSHVSRNAEWTEIDETSRVWTVPKARVKKWKRDEDFRVPLTDRMMAIIAEMKPLRRNQFVFPGASSPRIYEGAQLKRVKAITGDETKTIHGCRSTFRTWAGECTSFDRETREMAMAHAIHGDAESRYVREQLLGKRRVLMQLWDDYCSGRLTTDHTGASVTT